MPRILLRAPKDPFRTASPRRALRLDLLGGDTGRLLAPTALHRLLWTPSTEVVTGRRIEGKDAAARMNAEVDHVVLPLGAALGPLSGPRLDRLSEVVEALRVPVTVVGLGARLPLSGSAHGLDGIRSAVVRLMRAVLDRSASVGVTGEFTERYLTGLGFRDVEAVGDPALLLGGPQARVRPAPPALTAGSRIALSLAAGTTALEPLAARHVRAYPNLRHVAQSRHSLALLLARGARRRAGASAVEALLAEGRTSLFLDPLPWVRRMASYELAFGNRFTGVAAALLAGTPGRLLATDGGALESARAFDVPYRTVHRVTDRTDAAGLLDEADQGPFAARLPERFDRFADFLRRNGLRPVEDARPGATLFDRHAASVRFPDDVAGTDTAAVVRALPASRAERRAA